MVRRSCFNCKARKVCSSWNGLRPFIGQVVTEHGNYSKMKETYDEVAGIIAKVCDIYQSSPTTTKTLNDMHQSNGNCN